ncbi:MlaD family protein [Gordonia amicalis]|uniref:MlaD family protein n=1 Tax=Gordonia amicalis TaxID=89053 RepID=UPI0002A65A6F|nr:MlaD family protein [Gordonia amicalis]MDV7099768.1 MlaD family protein [Gordonia amicalis]UKO91109.1 MlaD family protein [Gordonia amicalis]UOG22576.1 MlaD family protein [Gordonia amicalis]GAC51842.1 Mce family protein [Gordonia amicalis NBRC 100051 = JCM 11271]
MTGQRLKSVAIAVVAAVGIVGSGVLVAQSGDTVKLAADRGDGREGYCADLPDVIGLYVGNPITQMGHQIGEVTSVRGNGATVRVMFDLDGGRAYPADVKAVTRSKSLLADRSLELVGNYVGGPQLQPGRCITSDRSFTPKSISEISGSASDFIEALTDAGSPDVQDAVTGLDEALAGTSPDAANMYRHAAEAARNPDQVISDIGTTISNMAPLTDEALAQWNTIDALLSKAPVAASQGAELLSKEWVPDFNDGVGWLVTVLWDIHINYGDTLWPTLKGPVRDIIETAATRAPDLRRLYETVPSIAAVLKQQARASGGLAVPYRSPKITDGRTSTDLFTFMLSTAGAK